jgi:carboxymethylenebutenolidase
MSDFIQIATPSGTFNAFVVRPAIAIAPVVVVLQEIFGINDDMKATCHELADRGYIALCPDLFWRQEPGLSLSHWSEEEWKKGLALYAAFDFDKGVTDIAETIALARSLPGSSGKVGVIGYCLGGLMAFLTAARVGADAAVAYYPGGADKYVDEADKIVSPFMVHLGEEDEFISKDAQRAIKEALADNPNAQVFSYPGCSHAFARHSGTHYDDAAAALANGRTWSLYNDRLR